MLYQSHKLFFSPCNYTLPKRTAVTASWSAAPLPANSPLRSGHVGYNFSDEYIRKSYHNSVNDHNSLPKFYYNEAEWKKVQELSKKTKIPLFSGDAAEQERSFKKTEEMIAWTRNGLASQLDTPQQYNAKLDKWEKITYERLDFIEKVFLDEIKKLQ